MNKQKFSGQLDEFGFPFLLVDLINPNTNEYIIKAKAIIDTGAAVTHIKQHVIDAINLTSEKEENFKHITGGNIKSGIFEMNIKFNGSVIVPNVKSYLLHQASYPSDLVIGLDILRYCNFEYNSVQKTFSFHLFPNSNSPNLKKETDL